MGVLKDLEQVIGRAGAERSLVKPGHYRRVMCLESGSRQNASRREALRQADLPPQDASGQSASGQSAEAEIRSENILCLGDNLKLMKGLLEGTEAAEGGRSLRGKIQMIYIDPPFFSKSDYDAVLSVQGKNIRHKAYQDRWKAGMYGYLRQLTARLLCMKDLLAEDGLIFLHLDWHAVHYAKVIMDEIFGEKNFVNEIIWTYKSGGSTKKRFARKHDNILVYGKSGKYKFRALQEKSYNRGLKPYRFKGVEEFEDEIGWYTMVNMKDVWAIDMVGRTSGERTGYATQKPEQLIRRIIQCSTEEGDLVADFFCGSGTLPRVALETGRRFIACDAEELAIESTLGRLHEGMEEMGEDAPSLSVLSESEPGWESEGKLPPFDCEVEVTEGERTLLEDPPIQIRILSVKERRLQSRMDQGDAGFIREMSRKDPLALVRSWSIDFQFDGTVFRPGVMAVRKGSGLETVFRLRHLPENSRIMMRVTDVLVHVVYRDLTKQIRQATGMPVKKEQMDV